MCGISGAVSLSGQPVDVDAVARMNRTLAHRGPDGDGLFVSPDRTVVLAHRRLAIIDLAGGAQPMAAADGRVQIVFNGEIYNYRELRDELRAEGVRFHSDSDTEVILAGWLRQGASFVSRLRGMFAYALWDARDGAVQLARDRFGKKPLFYGEHDGVLYFASEMKALLAVLPRPSVDHAALLQYLTLSYVPGARTIHREIQRVAPGHTATIAGGAIATRRYWELPRPDDADGRDDDWEGEIAAELEAAVRMRLVADVPLGSFLSGGLDSSTVVALAKKNVDHPFHTFSIRVRAGSSADADAAQRMARVLDTVHHEELVDCPSPRELETMMRQFDEPFADSSLIPTWAVSAVARKHVTVALSGDGGDEIFGGYSAYFQFERLSRIAAVAGVRGVARLASTFWPERIRGKQTLDVLAADDATRYARLMAHHWGDAAWRRVGGSVDERTRAVAELLDLHRAPTDAGWVARAQWIDAARTYLPGNILPKVDICSMAHSLEVRAPLLDHVLAERLSRLPRALRMQGRRGKLLLRQIAARWLPVDIIERQKVGFSVPLAAWLAGPLRGFVVEQARDTTALRRLDIDPQLLDELAPVPTNEAEAQRQFVVLALAVWARGRAG